MTGSNLDGSMNPKELALAIGELLQSLQLARSTAALEKSVSDAWDKVHGELTFGWANAKDYAKEIEARFGIE